jgi:hypothetical protein
MAKKIVIKILAKAKIKPDNWPDKLKEQLLEYGDTSSRLRKRVKKVLPDVQPAVDKGAKLKILAIPDNQLIGYEFFSPPGKNVKVLLTKIKLEGTKIKAFIPCQGTEEDAKIDDDELEESILEGAEDATEGEEKEAERQEQRADTTAGQEADAANLAAVFKQRLQTFRPSFDTALAQARANNPELAEELDGLFAQMFDEAKAKNFEMALQTLDTLTKRVTSALPGPAPPLPDNKAPAQFNARQKELMAAVTEAQEIDPVAAAELKEQVRNAQALARDKDYDEAHELLDEVEARLEKVRSGEDDEEDEDEKRRQWFEECARIEGELTTLLTLKPANAAKMKLLLTEGKALAEPDGNIDQAWDKLRELADLVENGLYSAGDEGAPAAPLTPAANAALAKLWQQRYADWGADIKKALALKPANAADIATPHDKALKLAQPKGDYRQALGLLRQAVDEAWGVINAQERHEDPSSPGEQIRLRARLAELLPEINEAKTTKTPFGQAIKSRQSEMMVLIGKSDFAGANDILDQIERDLNNPPADVGPSLGMAVWQKARVSAVNQLRSVSAQIARTKDLDAGPVVRVLESIVRQLTPNPSSPQSVAELKRYLKYDDVITAAEEVPAQYGKLKIKAPLLRALAALERTK